MRPVGVFSDARFLGSCSGPTGHRFGGCDDSGYRLGSRRTEDSPPIGGGGTGNGERGESSGAGGKSNTAAIAGACQHARPLAPPSIDSHEEHRVEFVVAVKAYDMGEIDHPGKTQRYLEMSYDLDNTCTGQGQGPSCVNSHWTLETPIEEGPDGRDNAAGAIIYRSHQQGQTASTVAANANIDSGLVTAVIRVRGYNEQRFDSKVEVAVLAATMYPRGEANELLRPPSAPNPQWHGEDVWAGIYPWWVDNDANGQPSIEHPKFFDQDAYVTENVLVAKLERFQMPSFTQMAQVVLTATIVHNGDGRWALTNGVFAGRARTDDMLASLDSIRDSEGEILCLASASYPRMKRTLCGAADVLFERSADASADCDATSWGWTFEAQPARLSGTGTFIRFTNCPWELSPGNDSCMIHD